MVNIYKIELAAKCASDDEKSRRLVDNFTNNAKLKINYNERELDITFNDRDTLCNNERYAIILSSNLSYKVKCGDRVRIEWDHKEKSPVILNLGLDDDDSHYNHVLTDVRTNNRLMKIPKEIYSVCSSCSHMPALAELFVTIYTEKD